MGKHRAWMGPILGDRVKLRNAIVVLWDGGDRSEVEASRLALA